MNQHEFTTHREPRWHELEATVAGLEGRGVKARGSALTRVPSLFRQVCADLALARHRFMTHDLVDRLNSLALRASQQIYRGRALFWSQSVDFLSRRLPGAVRSEWRILAWCCAFFLLPFLGLLFWGEKDPRWFEALLGAEGMQDLQEMYGSRDALDRHRDTFGKNFQMFGHYIMNNTSIDFRTFAGGALAGVGALLILAVNGLMIGASAGYVNWAADPESFWTFVAGHSAFELTGMIFSGMAGLRLGLALVRPGMLTRSAAIGQAARTALPLLGGGAFLTVAAAFIEGFWSPLNLPPLVKYTVGIALWVLVAGWMALAGRERRA